MSTAINWDAVAERATAMTDDELHYAIIDCAKAADAMGTMDREDGIDRAGRYLDEAYLYRHEQTRRRRDAVQARYAVRA